MEPNHSIRIERRSDYSPIARLDVCCSTSTAKQIGSALSSGMPDCLVRLFSQSLSLLPVETFLDVKPAKAVDPTVDELRSQLVTLNQLVTELQTTDVGRAIAERDELRALQRR